MHATAEHRPPFRGAGSLVEINVAPYEPRRFQSALSQMDRHWRGDRTAMVRFQIALRRRFGGDGTLVDALCSVYGRPHRVRTLSGLGRAWTFRRHGVTVAAALSNDGLRWEWDGSGTAEGARALIRAVEDGVLHRAPAPARPRGPRMAWPVD